MNHIPRSARTVAVVLVLTVAAHTQLAEAQTRPTPHAASTSLAAPTPHGGPAAHVAALGTVTHRRVTPVGQYAIPMVTAGVIALGAGIASYAAPMGQSDPTASHWRGGVLFDDGARNAMRFGTLGGRQAAATVSDMAMVGTMLLATTDAVGVPIAQGDIDLSWQAGFAYSLTLGLTLSLGEVFKRSVGRARPYEQNCAADPSAPGCSSPDAYGSFYSLHTSVAFASAGFSCAMHLTRGLYGDGLADGASCATSLALATLTGVMRVAADQHYLSDVLVGGIIGFAIGYIVPLLFVPERHTITEHHDGVTANVMPMIQPAPGGGTYGLAVSGQF